MSLKFILFLFSMVYSINSQGNISNLQSNKLINNNGLSLNFKINVYSQNIKTINNSILSDFAYTPPPAEKKKKNKKKKLKKIRRKKLQGKGFILGNILWYYIVIPLIVAAVLSPLAFLIAGVILGISYFIIAAIAISAVLLLISTIFYLAVKSYALYASLLANVYLLIISLVFLIWGAILSFPLLWIFGLIFLLAILVLSLIIFLVEMMLF